jgi:hypothetical protein
VGPQGPRGDAAHSPAWSRPGEPGPSRGGAAPVLHDPFLQPAAPARPRRTPWPLIVAVTSSALFLASSAAFVWLWQTRTPVLSPGGEPREDVVPAPPSAVVQAPSASASAPAVAPAAPTALPTAVPQGTRVIPHGRLTIVDLGVASPKTLAEELAVQRANGQAEGQTLVLTVVRFGKPGIDELYATLPHPLMQSALDGVRLVRVDAYHFEHDLDELGVPTKEFPWFFLLGPDLVPRDGISGAEWDENIPENMAPVLGAFVKGTYAKRRQRWTPPRGKGVQL